jgi:type I restriction enzyme, R subunit
MKRFREVQLAQRVAVEKGDEAGAKDAKAELDALVVFKSDMAAYVRLYTFLSQVFDYGSTGIEKRSLFYRTILPLLEFGREREAIDLSKVKLSHYALRSGGVALMLLPEGQTPKLEPLTEAGSGSVQNKEKTRLAAIIEKVNELFEGELTDQDRLVYVDTVIKTKLLESKTLLEQAVSNSKEQFATSPDLDSELLGAVMAALDAHNTMSSQALNSDKVRAGLKAILLNYAGLWEALRAKSG